jgi:hypothetical protein
MAQLPLGAATPTIDMSFGDFPQNSRRADNTWRIVEKLEDVWKL